MIRLHPIPDGQYSCPHCLTPLDVQGWYMPGMRTLADLRCRQCGRSYYGDLPSGFGLHYPMLLDQETSQVHDVVGARWFAEWMSAYRQRSSEPIPLEVIEARELRRPLLLNCIDGLYGHTLLKLLNAQRHLENNPDFDLVVLVPRFLQWLVPDGVAATWVVDLPLERGSIWSDALATALARRLDDLPAAWLSIARTHPAPATYSIERFTRVAPKPLVPDPPPERPAVTFAWRDDRRWTGGRSLPSRFVHRAQRRCIVELADRIRRAFGDVDLAVTGIASPGGFPSHIADLRTTEVDPSVERHWCRRYAASDVVVGVHGSNMLLPSAHASITIELVPRDRHGHAGQSFLPRGSDIRDGLYRHRLLPLECSPEIVAAVATEAIRHLGNAIINFVSAEEPGAPVGADPLHLARLQSRARGSAWRWES